MKSQVYIFTHTKKKTKRILALHVILLHLMYATKQYEGYGEVINVVRMFLCALL